MEFLQSFNSEEYFAERSKPFESVTKQVLDSFERNEHPNQRKAEALCRKWSTLRERFSICINYENLDREN